MSKKILALDLEGTLISNGMSQIPRNHLFYFLKEVKLLFEEIVIYTTLKKEKTVEILNVLYNEGTIPEYFKSVEIIEWTGPYKKLKNISSNINDILIIDDCEDYIAPEEKSNWIKINQFYYPYKNDDELLYILEKIKNKLF